jgi:hypothetical protein
MSDPAFIVPACREALAWRCRWTPPLAACLLSWAAQLGCRPSAALLKAFTRLLVSKPRRAPPPPVDAATAEAVQVMMAVALPLLVACLSCSAGCTAQLVLGCCPSVA